MKHERELFAEYDDEACQYQLCIGDADPDRAGCGDFEPVGELFASDDASAAMLVDRLKAAAQGTLTRGAECIAVERARQVSQEGWTADHDARHDNNELTRAAIYYASGTTPPHTDWPFDAASDKKAKHSRRQQLAIAGALIAAEIDRLDAAASKEVA